MQSVEIMSTERENFIVYSFINLTEFFEFLRAFIAKADPPQRSLPQSLLLLTLKEIC